MTEQEIQILHEQAAAATALKYGFTDKIFHIIPYLDDKDFEARLTALNELIRSLIYPTLALVDEETTVIKPEELAEMHAAYQQTIQDLANSWRNGNIPRKSINPLLDPPGDHSPVKIRR